MANIQEMFAFSEAIQKLYHPPVPIDGVKAMLPSLAVLFRSRHIGVDILPLDGTPPRLLTFLNAGELVEVAMAYPRLMHSSPNVEYVRKGGFSPILRISNHCFEPRFRETAFYREIFKPMGWTDQLSLSVRLSDEALAVTFHRDSDFSDEEAELAGLLQKHMAKRFEGTLSAELRTHSAAWDIPLMPDLRPDVLPVFVASLLGEYFPLAPRCPGELPAVLTRWLRTSMEREARCPGHIAHMKVSARHGCLQCWFRSRPQVVLTLLEKKSNYEFSRLNHYGLTSRQIDIAFWLTQGKSDAEIASLLEVAPRTVSKHVENVLAKLGCENRTAAAVQIIEWLSGSDG